MAERQTKFATGRHENLYKKATIKPLSNIIKRNSNQQQSLRNKNEMIWQS